MVPKINVYLSDDLAEAVKDAQIPVSSICQAALEHAVREVTALREHEKTPSAAPGSIPPVALDRYTNRARRAVELATASAGSLRAAGVGPEHLLIGVLDEGGNLAIRILETLGVTPADVRAELNGFIHPGQSAVAEPPLTPLAQTALTEAFNQSITLGHNYIGCEHLLLGLVAEPDGLAGQVLRRMGVELRVARRAVTTALTGILHDRSQNRAQATTSDPMAEILRRLDAIEQRLPAAQ